MLNEELVQLYQKGNKQALEELTEQNKGLITKLVNKFYVEKTNSISREDLEQEGYIGLIIAAQRYDFNNSQKCKFSTYAVYWIYSKMSRYLVQKNTNGETSLNNPVGDDKETELGDYIKDEINVEDNCIEKMYIKELRSDIYKSMNKVNTLLEREILKLNYGLNNTNELNLDEVSTILNMPYKKISNSKSQALRKLRYSPVFFKYKDEFYQERKYKKYDNVNSLINLWDTI